MGEKVTYVGRHLPTTPPPSDPRSTRHVRSKGRVHLRKEVVFDGREYYLVDDAHKEQERFGKPPTTLTPELALTVDLIPIFGSLTHSDCLLNKSFQSY